MMQDRNWTPSQGLGAISNNILVSFFTLQKQKMLQIKNELKKIENRIIVM